MATPWPVARTAIASPGADHRRLVTSFPEPSSRPHRLRQAAMERATAAMGAPPTVAGAPAPMPAGYPGAPPGAAMAMAPGGVVMGQPAGPFRPILPPVRGEGGTSAHGSCQRCCGGGAAGRGDDRWRRHARNAARACRSTPAARHSCAAAPAADPSSRLPATPLQNPSLGDHPQDQEVAAHQLWADAVAADLLHHDHRHQ